MTKDKPSEIFICNCNNTEHQLVIHYDPEEYKEVYLHVHLNKHKFFKRLWYGIRYIFGYTSRFGDWEEFIFKQEDADRLRTIADHLDPH